jgi:HPt (histidine-containing phosphotransfer) domain-containing protein
MSHAEPIYSSLGAHPALGEIVDIFVGEVPNRIETLLSQAAANDWETLGRTAHQLKGAFGSYGFDELTPSAKRLETAAREGLHEEEILSALDDMIAMCRRLQPGTPRTGGCDAANAAPSAGDRHLLSGG